MTRYDSKRIRTVKGLLWFVVGIATTLAAWRFLAGLGTVTNLSDRTPWGLWVGFDVMGGVALAAGGFVIAAAVYCFRAERLRPLLRPAVLTAFLGYVAVAVGLMFDLGRWWNIWRPMFFWQHHSVLFEVAWCVMLYTTVLGLEFLPVPLESSRFHRLTKLLKSAALPLVILGIMLSTLHQSSLGSLFLIAPGRVHPLWYSPILPVIFFVSAVALGLGMVIVESRFTSWLYGKPSELKLLKQLAVPLAIALGVYVTIRCGDLLVRGQLGRAFAGTFEGNLFLFEITVSAILPILLVAYGVAKRSGKALTWTAGLVVFGFVLHRIDVGGVSGISMTHAGYFPSPEEFLTSLGIVAGAILVFLFFVERFRVYEPEPEPENVRPSLALIRTPLAVPRHLSLMFVLGVGIAFAFMPGSRAEATKLATPVSGVLRVLAEKGAGKSLRLARDGGEPVLLIDGNRAGRWALFDHDAHVKRQKETGLTEEQACARCHHMNVPNDLATSCWECHRDEYAPTDIFRHDDHVKATGGNAGCVECHPTADAPKTRAGATSCRECHPTYDAKTFLAPGYSEAMHGLCKTCHEEEDEKNGVGDVPELALCGTCHAEHVDIRPRPAKRKED